MAVIAITNADRLIKNESRSAIKVNKIYSVFAWLTVILPAAKGLSGWLTLSVSISSISLIIFPADKVSDAEKAARTIL